MRVSVASSESDVTTGISFLAQHVRELAAGSSRANPRVEPEANERVPSSKVLVIGATGHTGSETVRLLVEQGVPVRAVTRDPCAPRRCLNLPAQRSGRG